jgi:hypothetical protein
LINNSLDGRHACYLGYDVRATTLVLVNDAGGAPYAGSVRPGHPGAIIENKQCAVSLVSIDADGTTLTMVLNISFKPGFSGDLIQYVAARDAFTSSGWAGLGVWSAPSSLPPLSIAVGDMTPARSVAAAGTAQSFTFTLSDSKGASDIGILNVLVNDFLDGRQACYLAYVAASNTLLLVDDAGDSGGPFAGGILLNGSQQAASVSNSHCTIFASGSSVTTAGGLLTLTLNIAFQSPFVGNRVLWVSGRDIAGGNNTDWHAMGTVSVGSLP